MPQKNSNKEEYISLIEATKYCDYTQEYLSLRARQGKLKARKFGRNWVTTKEWVEEYFDKTNSPQARAQEKRANGFLFSYDSISRASKRFFTSFRMTTVRLLGRATRKPELRYAIASVLVFVFLGVGFVWAGPTLSVAKDSFVEGIAVFSEEVKQGISKFSQDVDLYSDTARGIVKVPSVNIPPAPRINIPPAPRINIPPAPRINIPPAPQLSIPDIPLVPTINIPSFADSFAAMSKKFPSTRAGARAVAQNVRDGKDFVVDGFSRAGQKVAAGLENTAVAIANIPTSVSSVILRERSNATEESPGVSVDREQRAEQRDSSLRPVGLVQNDIRKIADSAKYGLGYTSGMVQEYTQWLNQTFVQIPARGVAENISIATASITGSGASFYSKYLVANNWVEEKIEKAAEIPEKLFDIFFGAPDLAKQETPEPQEQEQQQEQEQEQEIEETAKEFAETGDMEKLQQKVKDLEAKGYGQKQIIKEVKKITQIQPVKKITKETKVKVIDSKALLFLAALETRIDDIEKWEQDIRTLQSITKKLQANPPTTAASTAPVYIGSQGIQVGGAGIFSSLGVSGSAGLSNLGVGGDTTLGGTSGDKLTVNASSQFNAPIIVSSSISQTGGLTLTGALTQSGGDASFGGDVVISGGLTVGGTGAASFTASSTSPALAANQTGSGGIVSFQKSGTALFEIVNSGAVNILASAASTWKTTSGALTIQTDTAGDSIVLTSAGGITQTFGDAYAYTVNRGAQAVFAIDTNGAIDLTARGTHQDISIVPSGTGNINFHATSSPSYYMNSTGDLVIGGRFTFENDEYISNETNGYLVFQGSGGASSNDFTFDLDGSYPVLYSASTTKIGIDDDLEFVEAQTISTSAGDLTLDAAVKIIIADATIQYSVGDTAFDVYSNSDTTLTIQNTGTGVSHLKLADGSLYTGSTERLTLGGALANISGYTQESGVFTATTTSFTINSAGAVDITGAAESTWKTTSGALTIQSAGTFTATSAGDMILATNGAERMRILASNGYVGIATTTPSYTLDVWGGARFGTSADGALFVDASTQRVGIGTTTPSVALEVIGSIVGSGGITVAGDIIPATTASQNLGSPAVDWDKIYAVDIYASNLYGVGNIASTNAETFTINANATTSEDSYLRFHRGTGESTHALVKWDSADDRFDFNFPLYLSGAGNAISAVGALNITGAAVSTWKTTAGQLSITTDGADDIVLTSGKDVAIATAAFDLNNTGAITIGIDSSEQNITFETANFDVNSTGTVTIDGINFTYTPTGTYTVDSTGAVSIDSDAGVLFSGAGVDITSDGASGEMTFTYADAESFSIKDGTTRLEFSSAGAAVLGDDAATPQIDGSTITLSGNTVITGTIQAVDTTDVNIATANATAADIDIGTSAKANTITIGEATATTLELTSTGWAIDTTGAMTGIGAITSDGDFTATGNILIDADDKAIQFGDGQDAQMLWETADADAHYLSLATKINNAAYSGNIIISEDANIDWTHAIAANPTLYIQSADSGTVADYIKIWHDQADANIAVGSGGLKIAAAAFDLNNTGAITIGTAGTEQDIIFKTANFDVDSTGIVTIDGTNFTYNPSGTYEVTPGSTYTISSTGAVSIDSVAGTTLSGAGVDITSDGASGEMTFTYADAESFSIKDGTTRLSFSSAGAAVLGNDAATTQIDGSTITLSGNTVITGTMQENMDDNTTDAYDLQQGTDNYININTTNGSEEIQFGNATTNPDYAFLGSGSLSIAGTATTTGTSLTFNGAGTLSSAIAGMDITGAAESTWKTTSGQLDIKTEGGTDDIVITSAGDTLFVSTATFTSTSTDASFALGDAAGSNKFYIRDSAGTAQLTVDSNGNMDITGNVDVAGTIDNGLVAWWPLDEGTGDDILDKSGKSNDGIKCPEGWVAVPGNSSYGSGADFCVMKYEAKYDADSDGDGDTEGDCYHTAAYDTWDWGKTGGDCPAWVRSNVVSTANGSPIAGITQTQSIDDVCPSGSHLMTNNEWMTIARNIEQVDANWQSGTKGSGCMFGGHMDNDPADALAASTDDAPYYGTSDSAGAAKCPFTTTEPNGNASKRTFTLSNGEVIWDLSGNVWEWTSDEAPTTPVGGGWKEIEDVADEDWTADVPKSSVASAGGYTSADGIGKIWTDASPDRAFLRGGYWDGGAAAGAFTLYLAYAPGNSSYNVGLRCVRD